MARSITFAMLAGAVLVLAATEAPAQSYGPVDMMAPEGRGALYRPPPPLPRGPGTLAIPGVPNAPPAVTGAPPAANVDTAGVPPPDPGLLNGMCAYNGALVPCDTVGRNQYNYGLPLAATARCRPDSFFYTPGAGGTYSVNGASYYCP